MEVCRRITFIFLISEEVAANVYPGEVYIAGKRRSPQRPINTDLHALEEGKAIHKTAVVKNEVVIDSRRLSIHPTRTVKARTELRPRERKTFQKMAAFQIDVGQELRVSEFHVISDVSVSDVDGSVDDCAINHYPDFRCCYSLGQEKIGREHV